MIDQKTVITLLSGLVISGLTWAGNAAYEWQKEQDARMQAQAEEYSQRINDMDELIERQERYIKLQSQINSFKFKSLGLETPILDTME